MQRPGGFLPVSFLEKDMDLNVIREQIDAVDRELIPLFTARMKLSAEVAEYKRENNMPVYDPVREAAILDRVAEAAGDLAPYARRLYEALMRESRAYQEELLK